MNALLIATIAIELILVVCLIVLLNLMFITRIRWRFEDRAWERRRKYDEEQRQIRLKIWRSLR